MGWWKINGTDNTIGDGPLESLEGAVAEVVAQYQPILFTARRVPIPG